MPRIIIAQLRRRAGRTAALLVGVLIATTGFTVLTGSTATSRLLVVGEVEANYRAAYDVLVRPVGGRTALEQQRGLVRPNFLSGQYGGITMDQYDRIREVPGVDVAAPIAMAGYVTALGSVDMDLTDAVDRGLVRQVLRINRIWSSARGLTALDNDQAEYVYVTKRPLLWPVLDGEWEYRFSDGRARPELKDECDATVFVIEIQEDGSEKPLCEFDPAGQPGPLGIPEQRTSLFVAQLLPDGHFRQFTRDSAPPSERLVVRLRWGLSLLLAAVDPAAEAELVGLDKAVTSGRYLTSADAAIPRDFDSVGIPVLATTSPMLDEQLGARTERLAGGVVNNIPGRTWGTNLPALARMTGSPSSANADFTAADAYRTVLAEVDRRDGQVALIVPLVQSDHPRYVAAPDGTLTPQPADPDPAVFQDPMIRGLTTPWLVADGGFRPLRQATRTSPAGGLPVAVSVGLFDPLKLREFTELSAVPLETYALPQAMGADARSRQLLGEQPLQPDSNPGGYLATPPMMLTTLAALDGLLGSAAPISAIRVRVAGVTGMDELSQERVRNVAEAITAATGLDVDITVGSSLAPQKVHLPAGKFGRPQLALSELWSKKGVAAAIVQAVDRKSLVLFGLILLVCVLFLANAVSAAVRDRRRELAVLACLGWSRRRLGALIATEVGVVGLAAGLASAVLALPLSDLVGAQLRPVHAASAVPVALGLALLSALVPALGAARTHPGVAVRVAGRSPRPRLTRRRRTILALAAANLWRVPGRTALAAAALAIGIAAVTVLAAVTWAFHGSITGTLLGDAVSLRVRGVDTVAVAATVLLGVAAVADVLYLNIRDRAAELATLRATGWSAAALGRLTAYEGLGIGLIGAAVGAGAGSAAAATFAGVALTKLLPVALFAGGVGIVLTGLAALVPAQLQRRIPVSTLLAEE